MHAFDMIANPVVSAALKIRGSKKLFASPELSGAELESIRQNENGDYEPPKFRTKNAVIRTDNAGCPVFSVIPYRPGGTRIIYLHGGAFARDLNPLHFTLADKLCSKTNAIVHLVVYPKAPAHTYEETLAILRGYYASVLAEPGVGKVFFAGDSCGGTIIPTFAAKCEEYGLPEPAGLIMYSPFCDIRLTSALIADIESSDPCLAVEGLRCYVKAWTGGTPDESPDVNPSFVDVTKLPPVALFTGTNDILSPDAINFAYKIMQAGGECELTVARNMYHCYVLYPLAAAKQAIEKTVSFIEKHV